MKYILFSFFLFLGLNCYATVQTRDILIMNMDTTYLLYNYPLDSHPNIEKIYKHMERDTLFSKSSNTACWRGYIAEWRLINNTLYLSNIYSCDRKTKLDLKKIFSVVDNQGLVKAYWVSDSLKVGYGGIYRYASYSDNYPLYKSQSVFAIKNGSLKEKIHYNSSNSILTSYSDNPKKLQDYIYKRINWERLGKIDSTYKIRFTYECDSLGYITDIKFVKNIDPNLKDEILKILKNMKIEAIYYFGKFMRTTYFMSILISEENKLKHSKT